jgi:alpha-tubulin suppressor-like RCC1 family protein
LLKAHFTGVLGSDAWGNNASGELADGTTTNRSTPVQSVGLSGISYLSEGAVHGLALRPDGSVLAWGHNRSGELGNGTTTDSSVPVAVTGISQVSDISAGTSFSLAVEASGAVFAWGNNHSGELGNGSHSDASTPTAVSGLGPGSGVKQVAGGGSFGMALKSDGTVLAWGNNASGELGNGTTADSATPVQVSGFGPGSGIVQIAAGYANGLALRSDGAVFVWGDNQSGEVGDGTTTNRPSPVQVTSLGAGSGVVKVIGGTAFNLALHANGSISAWGNNASGELGDGSAPNDHHTPVFVSGVTNAVDIAAGRGHALALLSNGSTLSWGDNNLGQLGIGSTAQKHTPVTVAAPPSMAVFAAGDHSAVLVGSINQSGGGGGGGSGGGTTGSGGTSGGADLGRTVPIMPASPAQSQSGEPTVTG